MLCMIMGNKLFSSHSALRFRNNSRNQPRIKGKHASARRIDIGIAHRISDDLMARLTGELEEYRMASVAAGCPQSETDEDWFEWFREYSLELVVKARHADTLGWRITDNRKEK